MHIACSINQEYIPHMCSMIISAYQNTISSKINVHVLHSDLDSENQLKIKNEFIRYKGRIDFHFYKVNELIFDNFPILNKHIKIQSYYRLALALVLPKSISKLLYIDSDMIIKDDLLTIWNEDISDYYLGAVVNLNNDAYRTLGLDSLLEYFNAGFLLINLEKWRKDHIFDRFTEYVISEKEKIIFEDQDTLNGVLKGHWKKFHIKWNVQTSFFYSKKLFVEYFDQETYDICINSPSIIHYSGSIKPWEIGCRHILSEEYYTYASQLSWKEKFPIGKKIYVNKGVYVFGTGEAARFFTKKLAYFHIPVVGYLDNNPVKWGAKFLDKPIYEPKSVLGHPNEEKVGIIIASMYFEEILYDLQKKYNNNTFEILN